MLSTKDIQLNGGSGKVPKTMKPGNVIAKVLGISLQPLKSDPKACYLMMHLEGEDQGADFEGFLYDKDRPELGRAKGQVGTVRYSLYPYRDGVTKTGKRKNRDFEIMRSLVEMAALMGKRADLDSIDAMTIEDLVKQASKVFADGKFYHFCLGGSAYMKDDGNKGYTLSLPKYNKSYIGFEPVGTTPSRVATFDYATHVEDKTESETKPESDWGVPSSETSEKGGWTPSGFNI